MTFKLVIELLGLCLFVPSKSRNAMYVLLPKAVPTPMPQHDGDLENADTPMEHEPHSTRIIYDLAYTGGVGDAQLTVTDAFELDFRGHSSMQTAPPPTNVPATILNASLVAAGAFSVRPQVKALLLDPMSADPNDPGNLQRQASLSARLLLAADTVVESLSAYKYDVQSVGMRNVPLTTISRVSLTVTGDSLQLAGAKLTPPPSDNTILLTIGNLPESEWAGPMGPPTKGTPVHHYAIYYTLLQGNPTAPVPIVGSWTRRLLGPNPVTCLQGGGDG